MTGQFLIVLLLPRSFIHRGNIRVIYQTIIVESSILYNDADFVCSVSMQIKQV